METCTVSITLWGDGLVKGNWLDFYNDIGIIFRKMGYKRTHIAIDCKTFLNKKIVTTNRKEKEIINILKSGDIPKSISCYSLSKDYKIAMFDYDVMVVRQSEYISVVLNRSDLVKLDIDNTISILKQYIEFKIGEVYQMDREEMPLMYASRAKTINPFKSLVILEKF